MRRVLAAARRHGVLADFALTFAISWGGLLALAGVDGGRSAESWQSDPRPYGFALAAAWWVVVGVVAIVSRAATTRAARTFRHAA